MTDTATRDPDSTETLPLEYGRTVVCSSECLEIRVVLVFDREAQP